MHPAAVVREAPRAREVLRCRVLTSGAILRQVLPNRCISSTLCNWLWKGGHYESGTAMSSAMGTHEGSEQLARAGKLLLDVIDLRRCWEAERMPFDFVRCCHGSLEAVAQIWRLDEGIISGEFGREPIRSKGADTDWRERLAAIESFDGSVDDKNFRAEMATFGLAELDEYSKLDGHDDALGIEFACSLVSRWYETLKALRQVDPGNDFIGRWLPRLREPDGCSLSKENCADLQWFCAVNDGVFFELELALTSWTCPGATKQLEKDYEVLAHLAWMLSGISRDILFGAEPTGPYVLYAGKDWGLGLTDSSVDGQIGTLSLSGVGRQRFLNPAVQCTFKWEAEGQCRTMSWSSYRPYNRTTVFSTWASDSGIYADYPDTATRACWVLPQEHDFGVAVHAVELDLSESHVSDNVRKLVNEVRGVLQVGNENLWCSRGVLRWTILDELDVLFRRVSDEIESIASGRYNRSPSQTQSRSRRGAKSEAGETKYCEWTNPGDACFIIEDNRILFHNHQVMKDLRLKNYSRVQNLLVELSSGNLQSCDIKNHFCTPRTKPSRIVSRANKLLNEKIRRVGFTGLPDNDVAFIQYDRRFDHYKLCLPVYSSKAEFEGSQSQ